MGELDSNNEDDAKDPTYNPRHDIYDFQSEASDSHDSYIACGFVSLENAINESPAAKKAKIDACIPDSNSESSIMSMEIPTQWPGLVCDNSPAQPTSLEGRQTNIQAIEGKRKPAE